MEKLHPGAKWLFRIGVYFALLFFVFFFGIWGSFFVVGLMKVFAGGALSTGAAVITVLVTLFVVLVIAIVLGEIYARMAYNRWFYEFTAQGLKLERGVIWKKYSNIPYERIQNVDVHRGILARMLGFSTVEIQTAGFSGGYGRRGGRPRSEGHIPAVSIEGAEKIREFVMKKIAKKSSGSGM